MDRRAVIVVQPHGELFANPSVIFISSKTSATWGKVSQILVEGEGREREKKTARCVRRQN